MDSLSHSLMGAWVGALSGRFIQKPRLRRLIFWTSIVAANVPDLDVFFQPFFRDPRMGSLVYHRGYTHTWLALIPLTGILLALLDRLFPWAFRSSESTEETFSRKKAYFWIFLAMGTHILCDGLNDYGVHPWIPWKRAWTYGDTFFIIEPYWLLILLSFFVQRSRSLKIQILLISLILVIPVFGFFVHGMSALSGLIYLAFALILNLLFFKLKSFKSQKQNLHKNWAPFLLSGGALLLLWTTASICSHQIKGWAKNIFSTQGTVLDIVSTPAAGNPFCQRVIILVKGKNNQGIDQYKAHLGVYSLWSSWSSPRSCYPRMPITMTAPLEKDFSQHELLENSSFYYQGTFQAPWSDLENLRQKSCRFDSFLHFSRAPFWILRESSYVAGDLRYDFDEKLNFTEFSDDLEVSKQDCGSLPPWETLFSRGVL